MLIHADLPVALALTGIAVLLPPGGRARERLDFLLPGRRARRPPRLPRLGTLALVPVAALLGASAAGAGGACAATALLVTGTRCLRQQRASRARTRRAAELAAGLRLLVAELRAGAHPGAAAEGAACDAAPAVRGLFGGVSATVRLGGDAVGTLRELESAPEMPHGVPARMARAWSLAEQHGVALADLLDSVRRDLEHRVGFAQDVEARMAGPRSTAAVLAGLPVLGILLGEGVGAGPLAVLTGVTVGQVLLVLGAVLLCAGLLWTVRLTGTAVRT